MWGAISRLFHKPYVAIRNSNEGDIMDKGEAKKFLDTEPETYGTRQAKQRATVKWLLSKAFNNRVPENLLEPFYRNHEDQEQLKPQLVHCLANAELYCMALSNIYSDPNYNNLNHWGVLQALSRKGVYISDPHITETVLIQTTPIKLSAHQSVMQAVMTLYAKEVATPEFVYAAVKRFMPSGAVEDGTPPGDHEHALLFWINHATSALRCRIEQEERPANQKCPEFPRAATLQDLCDGVSLCGLVSFYCPEELPWSSISVSQVPTVSDCVRNLTLVHDFCTKALPASIFHMSPEDIYYMRGSMKHNLVVFLADLFNMLEIHPAPCVTLNSNTAKPVANGSPILSAGSLKKSYVNSQNENYIEGGGDDEFIVHRGRSVPTLSSVSGANNDKQNEQNERVAGKPSNWEPRKQTFAGRRSRRNSLSDESQLTLENFGGSQENLHLLGRNPDKEPAVLHSGRRDSQLARSSVLDNNSDALTSALQETYARQQVEEDEDGRFNRRSLSRNNSFTEGQRRADQTRSSAGVQETLQEPSPPQSPLLAHMNVTGFDSTVGGTRLSRRNSLLESQRRADQTRSSAAIQETLLEPNLAANNNIIAGDNNSQKTSLSRNNSFTESQRRADQTRSSAGIQQMLLDPSPPPTPLHNEIRTQEKDKKVTTFAALPNNTTTWQQQSKANQNNEPHDNGINDVVDNNSMMGSQLMNIRMKLEEKRRRIESEKRRMEAQLNRQRQKVGKAAFLQAVSKAKVVKSPESDPGRETGTSAEQSKENKPPRPFSLQDITEVEQKWLSGDGFSEERKTPDMDNMDIETYQQSIAQMNSSLHEIQADLQRLANQQNQLQNNQLGHTQTNMLGMQAGQVLEQTQQAAPPPPQMQSFASLHQQAGYTTQHINFNSQPPSGLPQQHPLHAMQQQLHQPQLQQHQYYNGRVANFNATHNQQQMQQMHSLMSGAANSAQHYTSQPWHSLSQQSQQPSPPQQPSQHNYSTYSSRYNQGFTLHNYEDNYHHRHAHEQPQPQPPPHVAQQSPAPQNEFYLHDPPMVQQRRTWGQPYSPSTDSGWSGSGGSGKREPVSLGSSPKQHTSHYLLHNGGGRTSPPTVIPTPPPRSSVNHAPLPTPPVDDMEPQSISFIGSGDDDSQLSTGLSKLNITSGSRTYRIPSPTRTYTPSVRNSFTQQHEKPAEQGFYISFDDPSSQPKRPKPPLRTKRNSPKKERGLTQTLDSNSIEKVEVQTVAPASSPAIERPPIRSVGIAMQETNPAPPPRCREQNADNRVPHVEEPIVIGNQPDPGTLDEMEKKKERILMMSLQRRQAAEEARTLKEAEAARRRDQEKAREEEKLRKKEEEKRRRAAILEQYKVKKAIEEAEREGKQIDKEVLHSLKIGLQNNTGGSGSSSGSGGPKMRSKTGQGRPRPKTIHIDSGADSHPGTMTPSRDKKGSSSNLSVLSTGSSTMRRDYYRGSQDCLAETRKPSSRLYSEMGDESRGTSPGRSLGRRSSYKTSRDASPEVRTMGRPKYGTYQARRKSNSLMNLAAGSSCDQDSLVYRYGDTDSGLGRATPPRRVPSPSGPGSLPATHHRRLQPGIGRYDVADNVSDAGSDYTGPRLYRQPATKSNKGIVLNAVEYCVFPGAVNKEAKQRVIEEMNRSEAKHFLVLFRDAGCQFRALYAYYPESEEVVKLYGTGPKQVSDRMFDKFFKYNSGGKCFSQVHTKHLTVTIDAFTIHNSLWQGKKVNLPNKRDMTLVI